jgi:hypothetical protein
MYGIWNTFMYRLTVATSRKKKGKGTMRVPLKNLEGSMTVSRDAGPEVIDAVNRMAELAYKNLK